MIRAACLAVCLASPLAAQDAAWRAEAAGIIDGFEAAVFDTNVLPYLMQFSNPTIRRAEADSVGMDLEAYIRAASQGYAQTAAITTVEDFAFDRADTRFGAVSGVAYATIPYRLSITLEGYPDLPPLCSALIVWQDNGQTFAQVFGASASTDIAKDAVPYLGAILDDTNACPDFAG